MFLREDVVKVKDGPAHLVHYCRDCNSTEVETIQTCKKCGSHNIANPYSHTMEDYNEVGIIQNYKDKKVKIYRCDLCGKEFDGLKVDNYLSYGDGEFNPCNSKNYTDSDYFEYGDNFIDYQLQKDLCIDCKNKLKLFLDNKLAQFTSNDNIQELVESYIEYNKE